MGWPAGLSTRQRVWLAAAVLVAVGIVVAGAVLTRGETPVDTAGISVSMSIARIAPRFDVTGKALAKELGLPMEAPKGKPLAQLGVSDQKLTAAVRHLAGHAESGLKYYVYAALTLLGLVYLARLGRPDGAGPKQRAAWYPRWPYVGALLVAAVVCGFVLGKSPNPMEGIVKVFKSMVGLYPSVSDKVLAFVFFAVLAVVGNKLVCGWACPFGALQELAYSLPVLRKVKRRKVPFALANAIRAVIFAVVLLVLFGVVGGRRGMVLYHFVNPFNLFNLDIELVTIGVTIVLALLLAFAVYRPYCQFICPFGLVGWLLERVSIYRVRIDRARCTECGACVRACPLEAAKGLVARKAFPADCFSCARCLNVCPEDAITYGPFWAGKGDADAEAGSAVAAEEA